MSYFHLKTVRLRFRDGSIINYMVSQPVRCGWNIWLWVSFPTQPLLSISVICCLKVTTSAPNFFSLWPLTASPNTPCSMNISCSYECILFACANIYMLNNATYFIQVLCWTLTIISKCLQANIFLIATVKICGLRGCGKISSVFFGAVSVYSGLQFADFWNDGLKLEHLWK